MVSQASSDVAERLKILASIPPLLDPSLPSPPPSPRSGVSTSRKRTLSDANNGPTRSHSSSGSPVGLGLIHESPATSTQRDGDKRVRSASSASSTINATAATTHDASNRQSTSTAPTPRIRQGIDSPWIPAALSSGTPLSPWLGTPGQDWRQAFPKERLRKLAARYRDCGRGLKHSGDAIAREARSGPRAKLALAKQTEAILLYAFAFWCDDQAAKACIPSNWKSIFGLLAFVKSRAEKEKLGIIIGLWNGEPDNVLCRPSLRMEALAVYALTMHEQKMLHHRGVQLLSTVSSTSASAQRDSRPPKLPPPPPPPPLPVGASATSPASNDGSTSASAQSPGTSAVAASHGPATLPQKPLPPPPPPPVASTPSSSSASSSSSSSTELIKQYTRSSSDLFKVQRLWEDSCTYLDSRTLFDKFRSFWNECVEMNVRIDARDFCLPVKVKLDRRETDQDHDDEGSEGAGNPGERTGWLFAWPVEVHRTMSVPHTVAFARAILEEWCRAEGVTDFESAVVSET
ncbi:hypothetical protein OIV83_003223 [Microbotryomycetes sp. JL201]|nr:hypothetical protein OIV83_003223 [Microbotryomycetes sp. JL201]